MRSRASLGRAIASKQFEPQRYRGHKEIRIVLFFVPLAAEASNLKYTRRLCQRAKRLLLESINFLNRWQLPHIKKLSGRYDTED